MHLQCNHYVLVYSGMTRTDKQWFAAIFLSAMVVLSTNAWLLWQNLNNPVPRDWRWLAEVGTEETVVEINGVYFSVKEIEYQE